MFAMLKNHALLVILLTTLAGCGGGGGGDNGGGGGGGGGGGSTTVIQPPVTLVQDILPSGTRLDVSARNLFPLAVNDRWTYRELSASGQQNGTLVRTVEALGAALNVRETDSTGNYTSTFTKTAEGISETTLDSTLPATIQSIVGPILLYAEPLYPAGAQRIHRRAGAFGSDLNNDGVQEGFRFEYKQVFRGFESLAFGAKSVEVAHFTNTTALTILPSDSRLSPFAVTITEDTYFAANFGMVKSVSSAVDGDGAVVQPSLTLLLETAQVGGLSWADFLATEGIVVTLPLTHKAVVYDARQKVYYATIPAGAANHPNSIAIIDATTAKVTYVALPAMDPSALALASDGNSLYVGLNGTAEVARLALPQLNELGRVALPRHSISNAPNVAEVIAPSPAEAGTIAVSLAQPTLLLRHDGVILVRNQVIQPKRTPSSSGNNRIVFSADAARIYGYDNELSSSALRTINVLADGVQETSATGTDITFANELSRIGTQLVLRNRTFSTTDLAPSGLLGGTNCIAGTSAILCMALGDSPGYAAERVLVYNPVTLAQTGRATFGASTTLAPAANRLRFVQGPAKQVAISNMPDVLAPSQKLLLFTSDQLP